jgi:adenine deaminase
MKPKLFAPKDQRALMAVALGKQPADLIVVNGQIFNVYTGEVTTGQSICVKDQWIACVTEDVNTCKGSDTQMIDADGMTVIPGLIDGHTHLANYCSSTEFMRYVIPDGTTCLVTETLETAYPAFGMDCIIDFIESYQNQPVKVFYTAPMMISPSQNMEKLSEQGLDTLLKRPDVLGLGEVYWQALLLEPETVLPVINKALALGKTVEGHSAGAKNQKLAAYVGTGVSSCHEPIDLAQVLERLRMGLYVMVREGGVRKDLEAVSKLMNMDIDLRRLVLVTDSVTPEFLKEKGYMGHVVQKAIDLGFRPVDAIRMATLNVAEHFGIDHLVGGIAPGRYADLCIVPDVGQIKPKWVISNGKVIAGNGTGLACPRDHVYSNKSLSTVKLKKIFSEADFNIPVNTDATQVQVRIIDKISPLVTREKTAAMPIIDGLVQMDVENDIIKIAAIDRVNPLNRCFVGLVSGMGIKQGAIASSAPWDTRDIIVIGADETDMALAVNRIGQLQGGTLFASRGSVLAEVPMPIMGLMSDLPVEETAERMKQVNQAARAAGCVFDDPILSLVTMTSAAIPYLRICEQGLFNLKNGKIVDHIFLETNQPPL